MGGCRGVSLPLRNISCQINGPDPGPQSTWQASITHTELSQEATEPKTSAPLEPEEQPLCGWWGCRERGRGRPETRLGLLSLETRARPFWSVPGPLPASLAFPHSAPGASDARLVLAAPGGCAEAQERLPGEGGSWCNPEALAPGVWRRAAAGHSLGNPEQLPSFWEQFLLTLPSSPITFMPASVGQAGH